MITGFRWQWENGAAYMVGMPWIGTAVAIRCAAFTDTVQGFYPSALSEQDFATLDSRVRTVLVRDLC